MGDIMRPVPFEELLTRIFDEYQHHHSIFGIPEQQFYSPVVHRQLSVFGESCATPVGPAAGPHTQLAQNIITSWLTGGRFIELKTVQILDRLELEKKRVANDTKRTKLAEQAASGGGVSGKTIEEILEEAESGGADAEV